MFDYDAERLRVTILEITHSNISPEAWDWFQSRLPLKDTSAVNSTFSLIPRKVGKNSIVIKPADYEVVTQIKPGFSLNSWTADQVARVCFLIHLDPSDRGAYFSIIENLFLAAEMSELVALYSSLPLLAYPADWKMRCAEGIRSNISGVLEAIMYQNPYPAEHLGDKAWNQLVMKAFFTDKDVNRIYGLDKRANEELALILSDYAHERWAAGRDVNPLLWRSTAKFIDVRILNDLKRVLSEGSPEEKRAAALTIYSSNSNDAKELLTNYKELLSSLENRELAWDRL